MAEYRIKITPPSVMEPERQWAIVDSALKRIGTREFEEWFELLTKKTDTLAEFIQKMSKPKSRKYK